MKIIIIPLILFLLICGCSQPVSTVATIVPTPVAVIQTFIETPNVTVGPTPTTNYDVCFDHNVTTPPPRLLL